MGPYRSDWQRHKEAQEGRARARRLRESKPPSSDAQCKFIRSIAKRKGWSDETYISYLQRCCHVEQIAQTITAPEHLKKDEASRFIEKWKD